MTPERWQRVKQVFDAAFSRPAEAREAFLDAACAGDTDFRRDVEALFVDHEAAGSFLEPPAPGGPDTPEGASAPPALAAGARLGPYEIVSRLGAGGMGEVYRARDTRLERTVAIKVLPADLARRPDLRQRFEREAKAISALNDPRICVLYDVGHQDGVDFLVMEYLEGETLAHRLRKGALPLDQVITCGVQIAEALDGAHRQGIVHRDLKPGNVMLTKSGAKLLDFGLAKLRPPAASGSSNSALSTAGQSLTGAGMLMGTLPYMAPEQLQGKDPDPRTDIFAFGATLYEMATGRRAFRGESQADLIAAILDTQPRPISREQPQTPPALDRVVATCLAKDPDDRWQSARDLARELRWIGQPGSQPGAPRPRPAPLARFLPWAVAAVAAVAAALAIRPSNTAPAPTPIRFSVPLSGVDRLQYDLGRALALLPDGSGFAFVGGRADDWQIHLHSFGDGTSRPLAGTERGRDPFFSPDGRWLGFVQDYKLKKVAVGGGPSIAICDNLSEQGVGGPIWGPDEHVVFGGSRGLWRVPAAGGKPEALTTLDSAQGEARHSAPHILPGGQAVLFTVLSRTGAMEDAAIAVLSLPSRERRVLLRGGASARYARTGHLVYVRGADLLAVPFDPDRLSVAGPASVAVANVLSIPQYLYGQFDLSTDGTLAYLAGGALERTLVWVDRKGTVRPLPLPSRSYFHPSLLPGDQGVIVEIEDTPHNIWHCDIRSGALTRLTHEGANHRPVLSPDGRFMAFSSDRVAPRSLFRQATDGSGAAERLLEASHPHNASSWSPDGRWLAFIETHPETQDDIWILPLEGDRRPRPFLRTRSSEHFAAFSPDGRWLAYQSDESGRNEVLIAAFPGPGPRKQVSTSGGEMPVFSRDQRELFYRLGDRVMVAEIAMQPSLASGAPRVAFELPRARVTSGLPNFALASKGDSMLTLKAVESEPGPPRAHVVINWFEELRRLTAAK